MKLKVMMPLLLGSVMITSTANASFWDKLNGVLDGAGKVLGTVGAVTGASAATAPMAKITDEQKQIIRDNIQANTDDRFLNEHILAAKDNIATFLEVMGCQTDNEKIYAGKVLSSGFYSTGRVTTIPSTKYHPLDQCMTVTSIGRWSVPVRDKLEFEVMFASDVSGESAKRLITMEKENGKWLADHVLSGY